MNADKRYGVELTPEERYGNQLNTFRKLSHDFIDGIFDAIGSGSDELTRKAVDGLSACINGSKDLMDATKILNKSGEDLLQDPLIKQVFDDLKKELAKKKKVT